MVSTNQQKYYFFCVDVVGSSINYQSNESYLKDLLSFINDFLKQNKIDPKIHSTFTGDGSLIFFKDNTLLPLKLAFHLHDNFRKKTNKINQTSKFKIGISYGYSNKISEAENQNGLPFWGEGPTVAKRLCDLCDSYNILINDEAVNKFKELLNAEHDFLKGQEFEDVFQDIGKYYVKHKQELRIYNFFMYFNRQIIGNLDLPIDKRGIIDKIEVSPHLAKPLDLFFQSEANKLVNKIDKEEVVLFIDSAKKLYEFLFQKAREYSGINKILPSEFFDYHQQFLTRHGELVRNNSKKSFRIMLMTKEEIRKDWYCNKTRSSSTNFVRFHMDYDIVLLQINPSIVSEVIIPSLVSKYASFYLHNTHLGIWKDKYAVFFEKLDLKESNSNQKIGKFWIISNTNPLFKNCENFLNELLDHSKHEKNQLILDDMDRPIFLPWNGLDFESIDTT
ncbi:MAG: hypothetical protein ACPKPY_07080 [Nitrososphaeraceae archaeon]